MTLSEAVDKFVRLRNKITEVKKGHVDQLAPFNLLQGVLEAYILNMLQTMGVESARTEFGTAYKTMKTSTKVVDWSATLAFIQEKEAWELLEARVSKTGAEAIISETGQAIPGVQTSRTVELGVRKS